MYIFNQLLNWNQLHTGMVAQSVYDWLRTGRFRDRIPVGARLSAPVQTGPRRTQLPVKWVPVLSRSKERLERDAEPSLPSSAVVKKE